VHFVTSYRILLGLSSVPDESCTVIQNTRIMSNIFFPANHKTITKHTTKQERPKRELSIHKIVVVKGNNVLTKDPVVTSRSDAAITFFFRQFTRRTNKENKHVNNNVIYY
jgi:hypothetical protein